MLTAAQIDTTADMISQRLTAVNVKNLQRMGELVAEIGKLTPEQAQRIGLMYDYGEDVSVITSELAKASGKSAAEIAKLMKSAGVAFSTGANKSESLTKYINSMATQTADECLNLSKTAGFVKTVNGKKVYSTIAETYRDLLDIAVTTASAGAESYSSSMRKVIKQLADSGIRTIDYESGYSRRIDSSVRQNVLAGVKSLNQGMADIVGEETGADGYEISWHANPRPTHEDMGGKQYVVGKARTVNGIAYHSIDEVQPLLDEYGCLHFKTPIIVGVSVPIYSESQLNSMNAAFHQTIEIDGVEYTPYEFTQIQRKLETEMRRQKDRSIIAAAAGDDDLRREAQTKINALTLKYKYVSEKAGLPTRMERASVSGYHKIKTP